MEPDAVIISPVLSEKTNRFREEARKKYVFRVDARVNKTQIMNAVHRLFGVNPEKCHIINVKAKPRSARTRSGFQQGHTSTWKKAIVTLREGEKIEIFEGS